MTSGEIIGIWIAALLSLTIFSFIYRDNPLFKVGESLFLGISLGYSWCLYYYSSIYPQAIAKLFPAGPDAERNLWVLIPLMLGIFILLRLVPSMAWLSRISFAVYIGGFAGIYIPTVIGGNLLPQIVDTMLPLQGGFWSVVNTVFFLVGVFATLLFFFFSLEHTGGVGRISRVGVFFIMVCFGASFGYTVMARVSLLIGRFQFLIDDWIRGVMLSQG